MSYISAKRMPHAYAAPDPDQHDESGLKDKARTELASARTAIGKVSTSTWLLGAVGAGAAGAAIYAALTRSTPAKNTQAKSRKSRATRSNAA